MTVTAARGTGNTMVRNTVITRSPRVDVSVHGSGEGRVESDPAAIDCPRGVCSALFDYGATVRLYSIASDDSMLSGWSACEVMGDCTFPMDGDKEVAALFDLKPVRIPGTTPGYYESIGEAYACLTTGGTIQVREYLFSENVIPDRDVAVTIEGGYDSGYSGNSGYTTINGNITVERGSLTVEGVLVR